MFGRYAKPSAAHDAQMCASMLNFLIAGRDTTACTLTWAVYELSRMENASSAHSPNPAGRDYTRARLKANEALLLPSKGS